MTNTNEFESLEQDLEAAYASPVPALRFTRLPANTLRGGYRHRRWQVAAAGALVAGLVAAIAFLPGYLGGATTVSAQELLSRSADASTKLKTSAKPYHIRESFDGKGNQPFITDTWSFGAAGNRSETRSVDGALLYGQAVTPHDAWLYATVDGQLRVVHIAGGAEARLRDFDAQQTSIHELVGGMVVEGCEDAVSRGSGTVAGRDTFVIEVVPTPATCTAVVGRPDTEKLAKATAEMGSFTVWIDKETTIQLKVEARDASGSITKAYTTLSFETGATVDESGLAFVPPAGAEVIEAKDYSEAKTALYGGKK